LIGPVTAFEPHLDRVKAMGFDGVVLSPIFAPGASGDVFVSASHQQAADGLGPGLEVAAVLETLGAACRARGLSLWTDLVVDRLDARHALVGRRPAGFSLKREAEGGDPIDPRRSQPARGEALARLHDPDAASAFADYWIEILGAFSAQGLAGVRVLRPDAASPGFWSDVLGGVRAVSPSFRAIAETQGLSWEAALALSGCGFDAVTSSLAFWDGRAPWLVEEYRALRPMAPLLAVVEPPFGPRSAAAGEALSQGRRRLILATAAGSGLLVPMGFECGVGLPLDPKSGDPAVFAEALLGPVDLSDAVRQANSRAQGLGGFSGALRQLTSPAARITALIRGDQPDLRRAEEALVLLINGSQAALAPDAAEASLARSEFGSFQAADGTKTRGLALAPGEVRLLRGRRSSTVRAPEPPGDAAAAAAQPRLVVEGLTPRVAGGDFSVKRVVGEPVVVEVDVVCDGHETLAVELQWRAEDEAAWSAARMSALPNDRWRGGFIPERLGRHAFRIEAWIDRFGGFRAAYLKKIEAGVALDVDLQEGWDLIRAAALRSQGEVKVALDALVQGQAGAGPAKRRRLILSPETAALMSRADDRPFRVCLDPPQRLDAERLQARYASWYELFPRSQTQDPDRSGGFLDVIPRLPAIRAMGFDVLYFPPIHPIGQTNRKGRNNTLKAAPGDPGSPYAIGSADGGHDAVHPELGGLDAFRQLVRAAADQGLEIALDFAIQCSPDHPWLKDHRDWFDWRPDGSIKYAENPPKKYEDIVNVDFYAKGSVPSLWIALRDVVLFWIAEGVKTFRVDNPHTKPLPFWAWMIGDIRRKHPDVIFLAEAFTRPKMMYRLAKIGFSQSYTYFTWRSSKREFIEYMTELTQDAPRDFFRPHFFVNTPDINPYFLQTSGRPGFVIRAALAATLSGLWGVYSGFELLESDPIPGKEEYRDSEKFEIKPRDWSRPDSIIPEITTLNRLRRSLPALQTHLGLEFHQADNEAVLYFAKGDGGAEGLVLVAISLDPFHPQSAEIEIPFWRLGLEEHDPIAVEDLVQDTRFTWRGRRQRIGLDPDRPFAVFSIQAERAQ
jgi:starch synthase (maltosyl-transferring)